MRGSGAMDLPAPRPDRGNREHRAPGSCDWASPSLLLKTCLSCNCFNNSGLLSRLRTTIRAPSVPGASFPHRDIRQKSSCVGAQSLSNLGSGTPSASAIRAITMRLGFRRPRSIPPRYVKSIFDANASCSCVSLLCCRSLAFVRPFHKHTYCELTTLSCNRHKSRWT
jgi:hypothetical protein